jgi:hypothetical protein
VPPLLLLPRGTGFRSCLSLLVACGIVFVPSTSRGIGFRSCLPSDAPPPPPPAVEDVIFVGRGLSDLRSAANPLVARITLQNQQLLQDLGALLTNPPPVPVAALIVPGEASAAHPFIRRAYNDGKTTLFDLPVTAADLDQLRGVVKDGLVLFLLREDFGGNQTPQKIAEMKKKIDALPEAERARANLYAGAVLADRGVDHPDAAPWIEGFHQAAQKQLHQAIQDAAKSGLLQPGKPYALGTHPITEAQLASIPADKVATVHIDGQDFNQVWVGASLVVVKPAAGAGTDSLPGKTGLDRLNLSPEQRNYYRRGAAPSRTVHPVPKRGKR